MEPAKYPLANIIRNLLSPYEDIRVPANQYVMDNIIPDSNKITELLIMIKSYNEVEQIVRQYSAIIIGKILQYYKKNDKQINFDINELIFLIDNEPTDIIRKNIVDAVFNGIVLDADLISILIDHGLSLLQDSDKVIIAFYLFERIYNSNFSQEDIFFAKTNQIIELSLKFLTEEQTPEVRIQVLNFLISAMDHRQSDFDQFAQIYLQCISAEASLAFDVSLNKDEISEFVSMLNSVIQVIKDDNEYLRHILIFPFQFIRRTDLPWDLMLPITVLFEENFESILDHVDEIGMNYLEIFESIVQFLLHLSTAKDIQIMDLQCLSEFLRKFIMSWASDPKYSEESVCAEVINVTRMYIVEKSPISVPQRCVALILMESMIEGCQNYLHFIGSEFINTIFDWISIQNEYVFICGFGCLEVLSKYNPGVFYHSFSTISRIFIEFIESIRSISDEETLRNLEDIVTKFNTVLQNIVIMDKDFVLFLDWFLTTTSISLGRMLLPFLSCISSLLSNKKNITFDLFQRCQHFLFALFESSEIKEFFIDVMMCFRYLIINSPRHVQPDVFQFLFNHIIMAIPSNETDGVQLCESLVDMITTFPDYIAPFVEQIIEISCSKLNQLVAQREKQSKVQPENYLCVMSALVGSLPKNQLVQQLIEPVKQHLYNTTNQNKLLARSIILCLPGFSELDIRVNFFQNVHTIIQNEYDKDVLNEVFKAFSALIVAFPDLQFQNNEGNLVCIHREICGFHETCLSGALINLLPYDYAVTLDFTIASNLFEAIFAYIRTKPARFDNLLVKYLESRFSVSFDDTDQLKDFTNYSAYLIELRLLVLSYINQSLEELEHATKIIWLRLVNIYAISHCHIHCYQITSSLLRALSYIIGKFDYIQCDFVLERVSKILQLVISSLRSEITPLSELNGASFSFVSKCFLFCPNFKASDEDTNILLSLLPAEVNTIHVVDSALYIFLIKDRIQISAQLIKSVAASILASKPYWIWQIIEINPDILPFFLDAISTVETSDYLPLVNYHQSLALMMISNIRRFR